jgi:hypothetical protein
MGLSDEPHDGLPVDGLHASPVPGGPLRLTARAGSPREREMGGN